MLDPRQVRKLRLRCRLLGDGLYLTFVRYAQCGKDHRRFLIRVLTKGAEVQSREVTFDFTYDLDTEEHMSNWVEIPGIDIPTFIPRLEVSHKDCYLYLKFVSALPLLAMTAFLALF